MEEVIQFREVNVTVTSLQNGERTTTVHAGKMTASALESLNRHVAALVISQQLIHEQHQRNLRSRPLA